MSRRISAMGVVGGLMAVALGAFVWAGVTGQFDPDDEIVAPQAVYDVVAGDCVKEWPEGNAIAEFDLVSCKAEHVAEVFDSGLLNRTLDRPYPGADAAEDEANAVCADRFAFYVGRSLDRSEYATYVVMPITHETWDRYGLYVCLLYDPNGTMVGTAHRSDR